MRLLVFSQNSLSTEESNGRITRTLLNAFSNDELSNFALRGNPNCEGVDYCIVTDGDALRSFITLGLRKPRGLKPNPPQGNAPMSSASRSARNHCIRDIVWYSGFWKLRGYNRWIKNLDIDAVFLMAADAPFFYTLARKVAAKKNVPLYIYSSEDYFLKRYNYMERRTDRGFWGNLFLNRLNKEGKKAFLAAKRSFLCSKKLENSVKGAYGDIPTEVLYQPSTLKPMTLKDCPIRTVIYGGNLVLERAKPLLEIAHVLHEFDADITLHIYGKLADEESKALIESSMEITYHGVVPYATLLEAYKDADMLVHAEAFDEYHELDYAHAFSTKIGDCYSSGLPFFLYGPSSIPCIQFGMEVTPEFTATNPDELHQKIMDILSGKSVWNPNREYLSSRFDADIVGPYLRKRIEEGK